MIRSKKELAFYILSDRIINGYDQLSAMQRFVNMISSSSDKKIIVYLKHMRSTAYYKSQRGICNKIMYAYHAYFFRKLGLKLGFSIGYNVFGYGLHIPHYGTIVVNGTSRIGNYCVLHTSVCIGGNDKIIGNGLYAGSGCMIMGSIYLGNNVSVASNSLVNKSYLENNILLAGTPATFKSKTLPWYERDGSLYSDRIAMIEKIKLKYGIQQ